jgi:hypothetical protein
LKASVTGYITALINTNERKLEDLRVLQIMQFNLTRAKVIQERETFQETLTDLLDFVEDMSEEKKGGEQDFGLTNMGYNPGCNNCNRHFSRQV